jgi:hypothetical protein
MGKIKGKSSSKRHGIVCICGRAACRVSLLPACRTMLLAARLPVRCAGAASPQPSPPPSRGAAPDSPPSHTLRHPAAKLPCSLLAGSLAHWPTQPPLLSAARWRRLPTHAPAGPLRRASLRAPDSAARWPAPPLVACAAAAACNPARVLDWKSEILLVRDWGIWLFH